MEIRVAPEERFVTANGLRHHVLRWRPPGKTASERPPRVVLCHGFLDHAWSFQLVGERLAEAGCEATAFSFRGHGESDRNGAGAYYHFANYVLDLHELWPALADEEGKAHLLGHSMGSTLATLFAASHPGQIRSLIAVEGLGPPEQAAEGAADKVRHWLADVDRIRSKIPRPASFSSCLRAFAGRHPQLPEAIARFLVEKGTREASPEELAEGTEPGLLWRFDPMHRSTSPTPFALAAYLAQLRAIDAPTLVVRGSRGFVTEDHAHRLGAIPGAEERLIEGGHMLHWEQPDAIVALALEHIRQHEPRSRA